MFPIRDHNPSERTPYITLLLLAANILIWLYGTATLSSTADFNRLYLDYAMIPAKISNGENYYTLVTSVFLHDGIWHLAGNMLFLWIYGDNMEDEMGHFPFLGFYLLCGAGAALAQYVFEPWSPVPLIGASGAIAGVMGGYLLLFPKAKVDVFIFFIVFFRILPLPAWILLGLWFALQIFAGFSSVGGTGGVAYWAHAGGFVLGVLFTLPLWLRLGGTGFWSRTDGHPDHPVARYPVIQSRMPRVGRRR